jgi:hypothetical protein
MKNQNCEVLRQVLCQAVMVVATVSPARHMTPGKCRTFTTKKNKEGERRGKETSTPLGPSTVSLFTVKQRASNEKRQSRLG